jgi:hypothetical protein
MPLATGVAGEEFFVIHHAANIVRNQYIPVQNFILVMFKRTTI